mgnify:CR=1 FL=1
MIKLEEVLSEWAFASEKEVPCPFCQQKIKTCFLRFLLIDGKYYVESGCYKCGKSDRKEITKEQAEKFVRHEEENNS